MREKGKDNMQIHNQISKHLSKTFTAVTLFPLLLTGFLAGCETTSNNNTGANNTIATPKDAYKVSVTNPYTPSNLAGQKLVRVALLAPFSSQSQAARNEAENINAATEMALQKFGDGQTVIFPVDSGDTTAEAEMGAKKAISQGADFILGPLFASGVVAAAPYARANNTTLFSFSTDTSEAGKNVYVFSFLPDDEINRIVSYAASKGIKNLELLLPDGPYGDRVRNAALNAAREYGIKIVGSEKYNPKGDANSLDLSARKAALSLRGVGNVKTTAILIPERGAVLRQLVKTLSLNGASTSRVQLLGTGLWKDNQTITDSHMFGGWFVSAESQARDEFAKELQAKYNGRTPTRLAGMGYDAMGLIARTAKNGEKSAISTRLLERNKGFVGIDGNFRFNDGVIERAMPIMEITGDGTKMIDAAPKNY